MGGGAAAVGALVGNDGARVGACGEPEEDGHEEEADRVQLQVQCRARHGRVQGLRVLHELDLDLGDVGLLAILAEEVVRNLRVGEAGLDALPDSLQWQSLAVWGGAGGGPCRPVVLEDLEVLEHSPHQVLPVDVHNTGPTQREPRHEPRVEQKDLSAPLVRDDAAADEPSELN